MTFRFLFLILIASVFLTTCKTEKDPYASVKGLWISKRFSPDTISSALLIRDSVIEINPYGVMNYESYFFPEGDCFIQFGPHGEDQALFCVENDGMVETLMSTQEKSYYQKANIDEMRGELFYYDSPLRIRLPPSTSGSLPNQDRTRVRADVFVGRLKTLIKGAYPNIRSDSSCIQFYDVLISYNIIPRMVLYEMSKLSENDRPRLEFVIHADKDTPLEVIDRIKEAIWDGHPQLRVYRAAWSDKMTQVLVEPLE